MANRLIDRWLKPRYILPALLAALVITVILSPVVDVSYGPFLSTRSRAADGAQGLREVLDRLGWRTSERVVPFAGRLDSTSTYFILHTPVDPTPIEVHALLEAVRHGARAIVVPERGSALADSIGVQATAKALATFYAVSDTLAGSYDGVDTLREAFGIFDARSFHSYLEGTPASDSDSAGVWPSQARTLLSIRTPVRRQEHPEIAIVPIGRGAVAAIADPTFLRNDVLRKTAGAVLAVRILESIDTAGRSPIVFDEYHQGYGATTSLPELIGGAMLHTTWGRAGLQIGLAALLYLLMIGVRPIAPVSRARLERRSPLEHVGALSRAYEAIGATGLAVQRLVRGVRRRHPLGTLAGSSDAAYLGLLRVRLPALASDIDTLERALVQKPSAEQLVSAGAAIDHIERNLIT